LTGVFVVVPAALAIKFGMFIVAAWFRGNSLFEDFSARGWGIY